ncbi:MAG TPA: ABC transporter permease [Candidatus Ozemobacteraceae bacterium]|nr:ABC transporter permease [Candidatus Ozemobacteraceae bacterium]
MNNGFRRVTIFAALSLFLLFALLVLSLFGFTSLSGFLRIATSERVITSMQLSVGAALMATGLSLLIAIPAGYALSRYEFFGKNLVDLTLEVPMVVTPVALGALLLIFLNTRFGELLRQAGFSFVFTFPGIVLAQFVTTVGIATRMVKTTFDGISQRYEVVACTLGATPTEAFTSVALPMAKQGILATTVLTFAKCIGEFGATIMIAGSMPMKTETLPISIFMRLSTADIQGMAVLILILLFIGLSALVFIKTVLETSHD